MYDEFKKYVEEYDMSIEQIKQKYIHSLKVYMLCIEIGKSLRLSAKLLEVAGIIGLLHDIGRFEQWKVYHTFKDEKSRDHGLLSTQILFEQGLIRRFVKDDKYDEIIRLAILNHGKPELPDGLDKRTSLFCKIIRDADKLDILKLRVENPNLALPSKGAVSDTVMERFRRQKSIRFADTNSSNDSILLTLGMIFDINFRHSLEVIKFGRYIDKIVDTLKVDEQPEVKDILDKYIKEKTKGGILCWINNIIQK